jgi:hypothetical protein
MKSNNNHGGLQHSPKMTRLHIVDDKRDKNWRDHTEFFRLKVKIFV